MALLKTRPKIALLIPSHSFPGDRCKVEVRLDAKRAVPVEEVTVLLTGQAWVRVGGGKNVYYHRRQLLRLGARLSEERELPAGRTSLPCVFELPADLPASYSGSSAAVEYTIDVHASIPWWPDAKRSFTVAIQHRPSEVEDQGPSLLSTGVRGPTRDEPHMEFSLSSKVVLPGGELAGEIALYNTVHNHYKLLLLSLVSYEARRDPNGRDLGTVEAARYSIRLPLEHHGDGEPIPFRMVLPAEIAPSQQTQLFDVRWAFDITAKIAWASNLEASVPVVVLPKGSAAKRQQRLAAPAVGSERVAKIWDAVAREQGLGLNRAERAIEGTRGEVTLRIERAHRGSDGIFLTGQLRYPSLGLDLDGGVVSGLRRVIGGGVAVGVAEWDKRHYLGGREAAQIEAYAKSLGESLTSVGLRDVDDEHMLIEQRDSGQSRSSLARFVATAKLLARNVQVARKRVPAPASMADALESWQRLATRLRSELDTCSMRVAGKLDGSAVEVATHWSPKGDALHTALSLFTADGIDERHRLVWAQGQLREGSLEQLPRAAASRLEAMLDGALSLTIASDRLVLWDPAPQRDDDRLLARLDELVQLAAALRGQHGPYR